MSVIEIFDYPHTVAADEIDELGHANNVAFVAWMQHRRGLGSYRGIVMLKHNLRG